MKNSIILKDCVWWKLMSSDSFFYKKLASSGAKDYFYAAKELHMTHVYADEDNPETNRYVPLIISRPVRAASTRNRNFVLGELKYPQAAYDCINADSFHTTITGMRQELRNEGYDGISGDSLTVENVKAYNVKTGIFDLQQSELEAKPDSYWSEYKDWQLYMAGQADARGFDDETLVLLDDAEKLGYRAILDYMDALVFWDAGIFDRRTFEIEPLTDEEAVTIESECGDALDGGTPDEVMAAIDKIRS